MTLYLYWLVPAFPRGETKYEDTKCALWCLFGNRGNQSSSHLFFPGPGYGASCAGPSPTRSPAVRVGR
jgi:hypothetical protein